jgi:hypothetical protein
LREQVLDAGAPIDFLCDACLQLALPFGRLFGGEPFVFSPRVRRIDCRLSISKPAFESAMRCGGLRKLRRELQYLARESIDVGGCRGAILMRTSDLESRRTQLLVDHVPGGRGPGHGDLVLGLVFSQLVRGGHHGRLMALLGILERSRGMRELLLEIGARHAFQIDLVAFSGPGDRARNGEGQIAG